MAAALWAVAGSLTLAPVGAPHAVAADSGSAVTVNGTGEFASLKVTVSQTRNLIDQVVHVTWTGAKPTPSGFLADYLQIMQCWSDDPSGPSREQCEFGNTADTRGGEQVRSRQLDAGSSFTDPAETQVATTDNPYNYVPFESASDGHPKVSGDHAQLGEFFDAQSTNEQPLNATGADGTGESFFETMTAQEAPGLGCGATTTDASGAAWTPHCWMVIVPRGETEVTGAPYTDHGFGLATSPLSTTNWKQRLVVPLEFNPLAISCPIGSPEEHTSGQEIAEEALYRWQAKLCKQSGTVYSYSKLSDDAARRQLSSADPGLELVTQPQLATARGAAGVVYAPLAVSAAVIAYNVDFSPYGAAGLRPRAGQRIPQINLTPRLVAKLVTESYLQGAPVHDPALSDSHAVSGLTYDPDFYSVNPSLAGLNNHGGDVLMPFTPSDLTQELWSWINADPAAKAFLDGAPDPWGMTVNPAYLHVTDTALPGSFLKSDTYCAPQQPVLGTQPPDLCVLDYRPYANDMHDAARSASRGDTLERSAWSPDPPTPHWAKAALQPSGLQSVLAFTDAATAARYSLPVARLENSSGQFVAPDAAGLTAGLNAMTPSAVPGVAVPNPASADPAAYPLTSVTYGATLPSALTSQERSDYADFIQFAATNGQQVGGDIGQLPVGYLPLPQSLVTQALTTSVQLRTYVSPAAPTVTSAAPTTTTRPSPSPTRRKPPTTSPKPKPTHTTATSSPSPPHVVNTPPPYVAPAPLATTAVPSPVTTPPTTAAPTTTTAASTTAPPSQPPPPPPSESTQPPVKTVAEVMRTPGVAASPTRYAVIVLLALGGLCALSGPGLLRWGSRRTR